MLVPYLASNYNIVIWSNMSTGRLTFIIPLPLNIFAPIWAINFFATFF